MCEARYQVGTNIDLGRTGELLREYSASECSLHVSVEISNEPFTCAGALHSTSLGYEPRLKKE